MTKSIATNEFNYWAFLSYSRQDNGETAGALCWGDWLHEVLKTFSIPPDFAGQINAHGEIIPKRIEPIFQDREEQSENASLSESVCQALEQSRCLVVVCSPHSAKSLHVNEAVRYFKQLGRGNRILNVVVAGEPNASDNNKPEDECFVPALRHPVNPDGTLDTTRRERRYIFADARHGEGKREILEIERRSAGTELEIAKIQLIAGLIGVGFNELLRREQKRRFAGFAEAEYQAREAQHQIEEARQQAQAAQRQFQALLDEARESSRQLAEARAEARIAQDKALETQNLPQDVLSQIQEAQSRAAEAHSQALEVQAKFVVAQAQTREAQEQVQEFQAKVRETQAQLEDARSQVRIAENKVLEAQALARETQNQLEEARKQARDAQGKVSEIQNPPQDVSGQIQEALDKAREAQSQFEAARSQAQETQAKFLAAEAQARDAQNQVLEFQKQACEAVNQLEEARNQIRGAQSQVLEAQQQARAAQQQVQEIRNETRDAQSQIQAAQGKVRAAEDQAREAQNRVQEIQTKTQAARRLVKVFAVIAVLALLAAGTVAGLAFRQRKAASPALAVSQEVSAPDLAAGNWDSERIHQSLQKIGGAEQDRRRSLDELAARIPIEEISETLKASALILDDRQRSYFQKQLLIRLAETNPASAMTNANAIEGKIVNDEGASDSRLYFQLAVLDNWLKKDLPGAFDWVRQVPDLDARQRALEKIVPALAAENPTNTLAQLNDLKPVADGRIYTLLFQHWAATDPTQAIQQRQQIPGQDADDRMLCAIMAVWMGKQPDAALEWVKAQPESESKNKALESCVWAQAKTDATKALALAESLPADVWRNNVVAGLFNDWSAKDLEAATTACQQLPDGAGKEKAWEYIVSRRIEKDSASAAELVKNLPAGDYRQKAIAALCGRWAGTDAPAALAWAQALPFEAEREAAVNQVVANWAGKDAPAAAEFARQHADLSGTALDEIAAAWSKSDLPAATNWLTTLPEGEKKDSVLLALASATEASAPQLAAQFCASLTTVQPKPELIQAVAGSLAQQNISNAVAWACGLKDESTRQAALLPLTEPWAKNDPKGMATYALNLPAGDPQAQYLTAACRQLAGRDLPGAVELLQPLLDAELRRKLLELAGRSCDLPAMNPAAKYIAAMPAGDDQKALIKGLLSTWTPADPESSVNWLSSFPETNSQPEQVQSVIKAWSQTEPALVARWLTNAPAGAASEGTISAFLEGAAAKYPEYAAQWTQSVADEVQRRKYQIEVARQWMKKDSSTAAQWINGLDLPEETKQSLKAPVP